MRRFWKPVSILLCTVLLAAAPAEAFATETGKSASDYKEEIQTKKDEIEQNKQKIENSSSRIDAMEQNVATLDSEKKELQAVKDDLSEVVEELDGQLMEVQDSLTEIAKKIEKNEKRIEKTKEELQTAETNEIEQYISMKQRIKFMYEKGNNAYISILFGAENLSEMLNKAEYVEELAAYDREMLEVFSQIKNEVSNLKRRLESEEKSLEEAKYEAIVKSEHMNNLINEKNSQIEKFEEDISAKSDAIKEYEDMIAQQNAVIASLEASILQAEKEAQALEKELEESGLSDNDMDSSSEKTSTVQSKVYNGPFCHPAPSYTRVSDDYGNRIHPILGVQQFHNGVDFAAPGGSPILAAQSGTVIAASYSSTMGNYIMINHGGGLITIYMHASALYVSSGQTVTKGQKIAAVGTTGRSTGNHLHFSVRLNGSYVSPWGYL